MTGTHLHAVPNHRPPFGIGGEFTANIRTDVKLDDTDLRESMKTVGWLPGHPAIMDEHGVIVVGHRRLEIAHELGIEPDILTINFGDGDEADVARLRVAWFSGQGHTPYSKADRKRVMEYLADRKWTQAFIAKAMNVSTSTVSAELAGRARPAPSPEAVERAKAEGVRTRAPGAGRPRGSRTRPALQPVPAPPPMEHLSPDREHRVQIDVQVWPLLARGVRQSEIIRVTGIDRRAVRDSTERRIGFELGRTVLDRIEGR